MINTKKITILIAISIALLFAGSASVFAVSGPVAPSQPKTTSGTVTDGSGNTTIVCGVGQAPVKNQDGTNSCETSCPNGQVTTLNTDGTTGCSEPQKESTCQNKGGLNIPTCGGSTFYQCEKGQDTDLCLKNNPMVAWIVFFTNLTATIIVIGATTMLIVAGIQYIAAADNAQKIQAAKEKIRNVLIGILAFFFMYAFLQWLIPGGVF